jgi:hypothetical protein
MPASSQQTMAAENRALAEALVAGHAEDGGPGRALRAVARHLLGFGTWRSFAIQQGLDDTEIVELAVRFLLAVVGDPSRVRSNGGTPRTRGAPVRR